MELSMLNDNQRLGVTTTEGPVLILAGAGSGKTRVLTYRTAYLIEQGVNPYNILAVTFTNKAASEMRQRIDDIVGHGAMAVWVSTFHSLCVRILRRFIDRIGYDNSFTIYDSDDSKKLMKETLKRLNIDHKRYPEKMCLSVISSAKDELIGPEEFTSVGKGADDIVARVYSEYQRQLRDNNALDFDDIIMLTVELLRQCEDVRHGYQERFKYIMVDEYQDTNTAQFELIRLLAAGANNLCVVGDDDQSIYKFRGANIYNILNFENNYKDTTVIKLEENYRSTPNILNVANEVIKNNAGRKSKTLWTQSDEGDKVRFVRCDSAYEEAERIVSDIDKMARLRRYSYGRSAILYRTNAQSRIIEEKLLGENIPYQIVGGTNFYSRMEIKDLLAYMRCISNPADDMSLMRIINTPKRGIGATTVTKLQTYALDNNMSLHDALGTASHSVLGNAAAKKVVAFSHMLRELEEASTRLTPSELLELIVDSTEYVELLRNEGTEEARDRIDNIDELFSKVYLYEEKARDAGAEISLDAFLSEVSLVADIDSYEGGDEYVVLMTIHSAKGLEFDNVYIPGLEENLFPGARCIGGADEESEIEEERRLCYVGITRARSRLTLLSSAMRPMHGQMNYNPISRFVKEIPSELLDGNVYEPAAKKESVSSNISDMFAKTNRAPVSATRYEVKNYGSKINKQPLDYGVGDRVSHKKFGEGNVISINDGGRDYEVCVDFDKAGTKKMFASFAKLVKV